MQKFLVTFCDQSTHTVEAVSLSQAAHKAAVECNKLAFTVEPFTDWCDVGGRQASDAILNLRFTMPRCVSAIVLRYPMPPNVTRGEKPTMLRLMYAMGSIIQALYGMKILTFDDSEAIEAWVLSYRGDDPGEIVEAIWSERGEWSNR